MNDLTTLRELARNDPSLSLRLQLLVVLSASLILPLIGLLMSYLREWMHHARQHSR